MSHYTDRIGKGLGLSVTYWEYFDRLPLDVQAATLTAVEALKASEDNQVAFPPQNITIFAVRYHTDRHCQEFFNCPVSAALRYKDIVALHGVEVGAWISTETLSMEPYQPVHT